jgi:uncharacterized protein (DUF1778 family)
LYSGGRIETGTCDRDSGLGDLGFGPQALGLRTDLVTDSLARDALKEPLTKPYDVRTLTLMRTQRLELRLTDDERQLDSVAATAVGETLSDFFRRAASARAQEVLADQQRIVLNEHEAARFLDALDAVDQDTVGRLRELRQRA